MSAPVLRSRSFTLRVNSVRPLCFLSARKNQGSQSPMPRRASASAVLLASVGACLRHLPPSHHSSSVTPALILFTICTQKPIQPQTMHLICTHVVCTRAIYQNIQKMQRPMMMQMCSLPICCRELSYYSPSLYSPLFFCQSLYFTKVRLSIFRDLFVFMSLVLSLIFCDF